MKKELLILLVFTIMLASCGLENPLNDLTGDIVVESNQGARVWLNNNNVGTVDSSGELYIQNVRAGTHTLRARIYENNQIIDEKIEEIIVLDQEVLRVQMVFENDIEPPSTTKKYSLEVSVQGQGNISGMETNCDSTCTYSYDEGTSVKLTANPSQNNDFSGWSGDCQGSAGCTIIMDSDKTISALFESITQITPEPEPVDVVITFIITDQNGKPVNGIDVTAVAPNNQIKSCNTGGGNKCSLTLKSSTQYSLSTRGSVSHTYEQFKGFFTTGTTNSDYGITLRDTSGDIGRVVFQPADLSPINGYDPNSKSVKVDNRRFGWTIKLSSSSGACSPGNDDFVCSCTTQDQISLRGTQGLYTYHGACMLELPAKTYTAIITPPSSSPAFIDYKCKPNDISLGRVIPRLSTYGRGFELVQVDVFQVNTLKQDVFKATLQRKAQQNIMYTIDLLLRSCVYYNPVMINTFSQNGVSTSTMTEILKFTSPTNAEGRRYSTIGSYLHMPLSASTSCPSSLVTRNVCCNNGDLVIESRYPNASVRVCETAGSTFEAPYFGMPTPDPIPKPDPNV